MSNSTGIASLFVAGAVPDGQIPIPTKEGHAAQYIASLSILMQLVMLGTTFVVGHVLRRNKIQVIPEAGAALLLGVLVGLGVKFLGHGTGFKEWINFNNNFFFYFLLPPIIFESGWGLNTVTFFKNFGAICVFAFGGTLISTFLVGFLIWAAGALDLCYDLPFLEALTFGALISATDPVTVLAIFNELGADPNLYSYVFGESVLNDAVAIVMYRTVLSFITSPISGRGIFAAIWFFIVIFVGSFSIGVAAGMLSALLFKYGGFQERNLVILESCLLVLFPYVAYMLADALELSGIVSILFAGITMKYYTASNLSSVAQDSCSSFFSMLAKLSETFVFIYMGVAMFLEDQSWNQFGFTFFTILFILVARLFNVYPCAYIVNCFRSPEARIPAKHKHALWFSGLRGAMAFALALESVTDLPNGHGRILLTSTLFTILFTVMCIGGGTGKLLDVLKIECRGPSGHGSHAQEQETGSPTAVEEVTNEAADQAEDTIGTELSPLGRQKVKLKRKLKKFKKDASFQTLDSKYLKPFFTASDADPSSDDSHNKAQGQGHGHRAKKREMEMVQRGAVQSETSSLLMEADSDTQVLLAPARLEREHIHGIRSRRSSGS